MTYIVTMDIYGKLQNLKTKKINACKCKIGNKFTCSACRRLRQKLVKGYHILTPNIEKKGNKPMVANAAANELSARILYEYLFDIITLEHIKDGTWKCDTLRDKGHQMRMMKLNNIVIRYMPFLAGFEHIWMNFIFKGFDTHVTGDPF